MGEVTDQVAPTELDAIDAELAGGVVDEPFEQVGGVRTSRAAIGTGRNLVRPPAHDRDRRGRNVVAAGEKQAGGVRRDRRDREQVATEVGPQFPPQRHHAAAVVERQLQLTLDSPPLIGGEEVLRALLDPVHRAAEVDRGDRRHRGLGRNHSLAAERAADVGDDHADPFPVDSEDVAELGQRPVRVLHRAPHGQPIELGIVLDHRPARLDWRRHQPRQRISPADDMRGSGECTGDVTAGPRPAHQLDVRGGEDTVADAVGAKHFEHLADLLAPHVATLLADVDRHAEPVRACLLDHRLHLPVVVGRSGNRKRPDPAVKVPGGDRGQQPRRLVGSANRRDCGVRVMGAHEGGVRHPRTPDVVDIARLPADHAYVLAPRQRLSDQAHPSRSRIQSATSGRYLNGMLLHTCVPSS